MEPGIKAFLQRLANTIFVTMLWMVINLFAGIKYNLAFVETHVAIGNILFYVWFLGSLVWLVFYLVKLWKKPIDFE